jgi:hypothetical protein
MLLTAVHTIHYMSIKLEVCMLHEEGLNIQKEDYRYRQMD